METTTVDTVNTTFNPYTAQWAFDVEFAYMIAVICIGIPGNLLLVIVQARNTGKTSTDYLVMVMAVYELIGSGIIAPLHTSRYFDEVQRAIGSLFTCAFDASVASVVTTAASQMLAAIAVDRCIVTCFPLNTFYTSVHARRVCVVVLLVSCGIASPHITLWSWNGEVPMCYLTADQVETGRILGLVRSSLFMVVFLTISVSYLKIVIFLRRRHRKKVKARKKMSILVALRTLSGTKVNNNAPSTCNASVPTMDSYHPDHDPAGKETQTAGCKVAVPQKHKHIESPTDNGHSRVRPSSEVVVDSAQDSVQMQSHMEAGIGTDEPVSVITSVPSSSNGHVITTPQQCNVKTSRVLKIEGRNLNRLTITTFLISLIYILTWSINWTLYVFGPYVFGIEILYLSFSFPMVNCMVNPIMFFCLSSVFRANVKKLLFCQ